MKNYKERKEYLGYTDISQLMFRSYDKVEILTLHEDGDYEAYIVEDFKDSDIPGHYSLELEFNDCDWMDVYDDSKVNLSLEGYKAFEIYTAGRHGILINCLSEIYPYKITFDTDGLEIMALMSELDFQEYKAMVEGRG